MPAERVKRWSTSSTERKELEEGRRESRGERAGSLFLILTDRGIRKGRKGKEGRERTGKKKEGRSQEEEGRKTRRGGEGTGQSGPSGQPD